MNQSILSWEVSQHPPYAQKCQPIPVVSRQEQQEATTHLGSEFENQTLKKEAIVLEEERRAKKLEFKECARSPCNGNHFSSIRYKFLGTYEE